MDSYETIKYSKNTTNNKIGKRDRLIDDTCIDGITRDEKESTLPMKYYTSDFFNQSPCQSSKLTNLSKGLFFNDGFSFP